MVAATTSHTRQRVEPRHGCTLRIRSTYDQNQEPWTYYQTLIDRSPKETLRPHPIPNNPNVTLTLVDCSCMETVGYSLHFELDLGFAFRLVSWDLFYDFDLVNRCNSIEDMNASTDAPAIASAISSNQRQLSCGRCVLGLRLILRNLLQSKKMRVDFESSR